MQLVVTLNIYDVHFHMTTKIDLNVTVVFSGADSMSEILCFQLNKMKRKKNINWKHVSIVWNLTVVFASTE